MLRRQAFATAAVLLAISVQADVPDYSLEWERFQAVEQPAAERILGWAFSAEERALRVLAGTSSGGFLVAEARLDEAGDEPLLEVVSSSRGFGAAAGCMTGYDRLALVGSAGDGGMVLLVCDAEDPTRADTLRLERAPEPGRVRHLAVEPLDGGGVLIGGVAESGAGAVHFLTAVDIAAGAEWSARLPGDGEAAASLELCGLADGGCAVAASGSPPSQTASVHRLGPAGESRWSRVVEVPSDCALRLNRLAEMPDGGVLCVGEKRVRGESVHGLLVRLGPGGEELWRAEPWYLDHSSLCAALPAGQRAVLLGGWMALSGRIPMEVGERDVMVAALDIGSMDIMGARLKAAGTQVPEVVVPCDDGELIVVGIHGEVDWETRLFAGRALLR